MAEQSIPSSTKRWRDAILLNLLAGLCLLAIATLDIGLTGCKRVQSPPPPLEERPTSVAASGQVTPTVAPISETPQPAPSVITLTLWTKESFSPAHKDGGRILAEQFTAFTDEHPDVAIEYLLKKPYAKGGILDFLRTTRAVIPTALPDMVTIDTFELGQAAREGLVQPMDDLISGELLDDLFPFARESGHFEGHLMGLQFEADIQHLIYNTATLKTSPLTWTQVLTEGISYIFPAGGDEERVNDAFLIQYFALGGRLVDNDGQPALDEGALTQVLEFYKEGRDRAIIPLSMLEHESLDDCWSVYLAAGATMSNVDSHRYLLDREMLENTSFAPIPTRDGNAVTMSRGWSLAIVTTDPVRQALAAELIERLMSPGNNVAWNQAVGHLPTRRSSLERLDAVDGYIPFLKEQMEAARFRPSLPTYEAIAKALQRAVQNVLLGKSSPSEAASEVIATLEKLKKGGDNELFPILPSG